MNHILIQLCVKLFMSANRQILQGFPNIFYLRCIKCLNVGIFIFEKINFKALYHIAITDLEA